MPSVEKPDCWSNAFAIVVTVLCLATAVCHVVEPYDRGDPRIAASAQGSPAAQPGAPAAAGAAAPAIEPGWSRARWC